MKTIQERHDAQDRRRAGRGCRLARQPRAGEIISRVSKIPLATVSAMARTEYTDKMDLTTIQPVIDASVRYKFLEKGFPAQELFWQGPPRA